MADAKISALTEVTGSGLDDEDVLAIVNTGATKRVKFNELISTAGLNKLSGTPIPSGKIAFAGGAIADGALGTNSVNTVNIKDSNVDADKLADWSTAILATSAPTKNYNGQLWVDTDDSHKAYIHDGSDWQALGAGTTSVLPTSASNAIPTLNITAATSNNVVTLSGTIPNSTGAKQFLAGPTGAAGAISARAIVATDLPVADASNLGAVKVDATSSGIAIDGSTSVISINNTVTAASNVIVSHSAKGLITSSRAITATDIPIATTSARGAVIPSNAGGLAIDGSGNLTLNNTVTAGTYGKVTVSTKGLVTAGAALVAGDIPDLAASKITSGTIDIARIGNDSITGEKMANSSTCIVQSIAQLGYPTALFTGQLLFDSVAEDAFLWDGNAWQAITTLTKGSLVNGGTFNASTSKMASITTAGSAAGLVVGSNLPTPSANTDGVYVVVATAGTPSAPAPVVALNPPDYILGITNTAAGSSWNEIDLSATVSGQIAANVGFTPYGQLSSTNCQDVIEELETEKLGKAGGEVTGELLIGAAGSLVFEGSTANAYETTITVVDPSSADRTATFPDASGTVVLAGNAQIVSADISTSAAIPLSKLANLTAAQVIVGNASNIPTGVSLSGDVSITNAGATTVVSGTTSAAGKLQLSDATNSSSTSLAATANAVKTAKDAADAAATTANAALPKAGGDMTGHLNLDNDKELRMMEADSAGSAYVGLKAPSDMGSVSSYTLSFPAAAPAANKVLKCDASTPTTLVWSDDVTNVAASALTGTTMAVNVVTSSLTTVGTIAAGTWAAVDVAVAHGGTGSSTAAGALTNLGAAALAGSTFTGNVNLGVDDTGVDLKLFGATAGAYVLWDESADELLTGGGATVNIVKDKLKIGGTAVTTTAAELNVLDGFTGDVDDLIYAKDLKATGVTSTEFDYLDGVTSAIQTQLDTKAATGGATFTGNVNLGVDDTGVDLKLFGATAGAYVLWDESDDTLKTAGGAFIDVVKDKLKIGGTAVTTTAAELNVLDGIPGTLTATELGYVDGVTSAIQTQLDAKGVGDVTLTGTQTLTNKSLTAPTITGAADLSGAALTGASPLVFEGSTADGYELTLAVPDVGADKTITLPDATTTLAGLAVAQTYTLPQRSTISSVNYGATVTLDLDTAQDFAIGALTGNLTLANPSNIANAVGQSGVIYLVQDGTGSRTWSPGSQWHLRGGAGDLSTAASAVDTLVYTVRSSTSIVCDLILDCKAKS